MTQTDTLPIGPTKQEQLTPDEIRKQEIMDQYGHTGDPYDPRPGSGLSPSDRPDANRRPAPGEKTRRLPEDDAKVSQNVRDARARRDSREGRMKKRKDYIDARTNEITMQFGTLPGRFSLRELVEHCAAMGYEVTIKENSDLKAVPDDNPSISERNADAALLSAPYQQPVKAGEEAKPKFDEPFVPTAEGGVGNPTAAPQSNQVGVPAQPQWLTGQNNAVEFGREPNPVTGQVSTQPVEGDGSHYASEKSKRDAQRKENKTE